MNTFFVSAEEFGQNIHSQYGEDGVIAEVSRQLDIKICNAMEFGAWNGYHLSNTFALVSDIKKLVLIEGDIEKFKDLMQTAEKYPPIKPICAFVQPQGKNSVDEICKIENITSLDVLSIDIDSYDLEIARHLSIRPKLIILEFNPTFGSLSQYENQIGFFRGNSFLSSYKVLASKGYSLCSVTKTNLFFVDDEFLIKKGFEPLRFNNIEILEQIDQHQFKISCGYDGSKIVFGRDKHPWDGSRVAKVYHFPNFLLGWEPSYFQVALRALRTLTLREIIAGIKRAREKGWF